MQLRDDVPIAVDRGAEGERTLIPSDVWQLRLECLWAFWRMRVPLSKLIFKGVSINHTFHAYTQEGFDISVELC